MAKGSVCYRDMQALFSIMGFSLLSGMEFFAASKNEILTAVILYAGIG